jgi:predicted dinucleotide-binding enzyme
MNIGIIGAGNIGGTAAQHFTDAGHEVMVSNSREPETLAGLVDDLGPNAQAGTPAEAAAFGEVVMEAIPFGAYEDLPADALADTIVISASNYYPLRDGAVPLDGRTHTELIADHLPDATVIKAFNTMYWEVLRDERRPDADPEERLALFIAGDDQEAKGIVTELIDDIGFTAVDTDTLADGGRHMEPGSPIYTDPMTADEARTRLTALKTVVAAHERGYYETPRTITASELADELDMSEESLSEHLRRGTEQFVDQYLQEP